MYADRHAQPEGIKPGSLIIAIAINAGLVGALVFVTPVFEVMTGNKPLEIVNIPVAPPPEPNPPEAKPERSDRATAQPERVDTSTSIIATTDDGYVALPPLPLPPLPLPFPPGEPMVIDPPVAPPVLIDARLDLRYARDLQPTYPAGERRAEREGYATVRVTIGADGRVTGAECVRATSDDFCRSTKAQALAKWRFRPATRDGAAVEASKEMTVRFKLES